MRGTVYRVLFWVAALALAINLVRDCGQFLDDCDGYYREVGQLEMECVPYDRT